jgi:hypothetical protein
LSTSAGSCLSTLIAALISLLSDSQLFAFVKNWSQSKRFVGNKEIIEGYRRWQILFFEMYRVYVQNVVSKKSKAIPETTHGGLKGCEMLRIPFCLDSWLTVGDGVVSPTHGPCLALQKHFCFICVLYSFQIEAW